MAPREPESWAGVRDAFMNGKIAPQIVPAVGSGPLMWRQQLRESVQGEDCLTLNLFTSGLHDGRRRPVMCWCHGGGGYSYGAGSLSEFNGNNLARRGDVVVVSITHRLNIFGHLDLSGIGGEEYADSANAGILDIRAALQWVQENIERFGGDPRNVMAFGQSGGGDKVSALCAMPSAKGLFHKAAVQSGSTFQTLLHDASTKTAESVLAKLGLRADQLHELHNLSPDRLLSATLAVKGERPLRFGPAVDGRVLPGRPFDPTAPEVSADVPMIIGTTATETTYIIGATDPAVFYLSEADMRMRLKKIAGDSSDGLIDLYRKNRPEGSPSDIFFAITTDRQMRRSAIVQTERKAAVGKASAYMYLMAWKTPVEGGKWRSPHTVEVPFVWDNINESASLVGTGPELRPVADKMSGAWLAFAHTGSPSTPDLI
jgi:para-nitrobenzyl esterase